jgi:hypothetical protein
MKIEAITQEAHGQRRWKSPQGYSFAQKRNLIQLAVSDLVTAQSSFPLAFVRDGDAFRMVAVCSFFQDQNLYAKADGSWAAPYVPAAIRAHPFYLVTDENGQQLLGYDAESGLIADEGQPLFDEQRQPTPDLQAVINHLAETAQGAAVLQKAVDAIAEAKLITAWNIDLRDGEATRRLDGLFCVDETALNALPIAQFDQLRLKSALPVAYAQLFSMQHLKILAYLAQSAGKPAVGATAKATLEDFAAGKDVLDFSMLRN